MPFKRLLGDTVLVEHLKEERVGLIMLPENVALKTGLVKAVVLQIGSKVSPHMELEINDTVLVSSHFGTRLKAGILYDSEDVIAKLI